MKQYSKSDEEATSNLLFAGNAMIAQLITKDSLSSLFQKKDGENQLYFGGKKLIGYTEDQESIIIDGLLKGTFEGLKLTVVNDRDGFSPALFQENPLDPNTKGWTVYIWHDQKISKEEFENKYMVSKQGVQFLDRLEGILGGYGDESPMEFQWTVGDNVQKWKMSKLFSTGKTYQGMLELMKELKDIDRLEKLPKGIDADSYFPNEWYSPGKAELKTMQLLKEKIIKKAEWLKANERWRFKKYKENMGKDITDQVLYEALYPQMIKAMKKEWNSWENRIERGVDDLTPRKVYLNEDGHVVIEDIRRSDPISKKEKELIDQVLLEKGLLIND